MTSAGSDVKSILRMSTGPGSGMSTSAKQKGLDDRPRVAGNKRKRDMVKTVPRASLHPTSKVIFKKRPKSDVRWKWAPIVSSARRDDLQICHWTNFPNKEYVYAQYNKEIEMLEYTDEEYDKYVHLDGRWTRDETDLLMDLCKSHGLRFIVIHDRYSMQKSSESPERTVEDLKDRFYTIQRSLLQAREPHKNLSSHPMFAQAYNKSQEKDRKTQLERLFRRSHEEQQEMANLLQEHKKYTQAVKKKRMEKKQRKKAEKEKTEAMKAVENSQRLGGNRIGLENGANSDQPAGGDIAEKHRLLQKIEQLRASLPPKCIPRNPFPRIPDGIYLRHEEPLKPMEFHESVQNFVSAELLKLGFDKDQPLTVPTKACCSVWDQLRIDIATVYNLEKMTQQKEAQTQALQERFAQQEVMMKQHMRQNMQG